MLYTVPTNLRLPLDRRLIFRYSEYTVSGASVFPLPRRHAESVVQKGMIVMSEPMEFGPDILTLVDEEGNEHEFEVIDSLEEGEQRYLALVPVMDEEELEQDDGELVILRATAGEEEDEYLEPIEDEEEFNRISAIFVERLEEFYEFEDPEPDEDDA